MGDEGAVRQAIRSRLPGYEVRTVVWMGEGQENTAYEVNGELVVRFRKELQARTRADRVAREERLLAAVEAFSPLPTPTHSFTSPEHGALAYFKIPGICLLDVPRSEWRGRELAVAAKLGELLSALHRVPVAQMSALVEVDHDPLDVWRSEAEEILNRIESEIPSASRPGVRSFVEAPVPDSRCEPVFSHNDLGFEHVIIDPDSWAITGIIDWSDAAIGDPAYDFGLIFRDFGPACLDEALAHYRSDINDVLLLRDRALFYGRCSVIEDLAYGIESGKSRYAERSIEALDWLFRRTD